LFKLFSCLFANPSAADLTDVQDSHSKIASIIGYAEYHAVLQENSKFFANLGTIHNSSIVVDATLDVKIMVPTPKTPNKPISLNGRYFSFSHGV